MPRNLIDQFDKKPTWLGVIMQEAITLICVDQDLRCYIAWLGHNKLSPNSAPKADIHSKPTPVNS